MISQSTALFIMDTPLQNWFNEVYARDTSRKFRGDRICELQGWLRENKVLDDIQRVFPMREFMSSSLSLPPPNW